MRYQLVLKFEADFFAENTGLAMLLDALTKALGDSAVVDDFHRGIRATNIFIWTDDPRVTFERARPVLESRYPLDGFSAAYREADRRQYTMLWPEGR